ncbi:hypothetical protein ACJX0J_012085, partial [Zea mays]
MTKSKYMMACLIIIGMTKTLSNILILYFYFPTSTSLLWIVMHFPYINIYTKPDSDIFLRVLFSSRFNYSLAFSSILSPFDFNFWEYNPIDLLRMALSLQKECMQD